MQWFLAALHTPAILWGTACPSGWMTELLLRSNCLDLLDVTMQLKKNKKKETNKKTPSSQSFHFLRLAYKDKEKCCFFFIQLGSFFAPTIGITRDRNISNYTLNQIIPTHKRWVLGILKREDAIEKLAACSPEKHIHCMWGTIKDRAAGSALAKESFSIHYSGVMYTSETTRGVFNHIKRFNQLQFTSQGRVVIATIWLFQKCLLFFLIFHFGNKALAYCIRTLLLWCVCHQVTCHRVAVL